MNKFLLSLSLLVGLGANAQAPVNDLCGDASVLTIGETCVPVSGTLMGATDAGLNSTANFNNVFYKFVATDTRVIVNAYHATLDLVVDIYGGECGNLLPLSSVDSYGSGLEVGLVTDLTVGSTYYVSIRDFNGVNNEATEFQVCLEAATPPVNDECAGALVVTPLASEPTSAEDFVISDLLTATVSSTTTNCEESSLGLTGDVWFKFVATEEELILHVIQEGYLDAQLDVYAGTDCDNLIYLGCVDGAASAPGSETQSDDEIVVLTQLTVGNTYFVRAKDYFGHLFGTSLGVALYPNPTASIGKIAEDAVNVYPNPATDVINIAAKTEITSVVVTNTVGQVVSTLESVNGSSVSINTNEMATGLYNVTIYTAEGQTSKLINVAK